MEIIKNIFLFPILIFFPLYFWGYIFSRFHTEVSGLRMRFLMGMMLGIFSVGIFFLITKIFNEFSSWVALASVGFFLILSYAIIFFATKKSHKIVAGFIQKISILHGILAFFCFLIFVLVSYFFQAETLLLGALVAIFFSAFFEEIAKHFTMLGLMGKYYSFSLRDITIFAFCIVLGFVFVENFLYLMKYDFSVGLTLSRSIFSFSAHLASVMLAVIFWWKALAHPLASWKYIFYFVAGLLLSVLCHTFFNYAVSSGQNIFLLGYLLLAYGLFVFWFKK